MEFKRTDGKKKNRCILCVAFYFLFIMTIKAYAAEDSDIFSAASAKVYTSMSEDSDVAANLIMGNMFEVLDAQGDADGIIWYLVRTDFGAEGYVKADELDRVLMQEPQASMDEGAQDDENVQIPENMQVPENIEGEEDSEGTNNDPIGKLVVQEAVNLRRMPSTGSEILGRINRNTMLPYYEQITNDADEIWYRVIHEGSTGYVTDGAVTVMQQSSKPVEGEQASVETETEQDTQTQKPIQESMPIQEETQFGTETSTITSNVLEVDNETEPQRKGRRGFDKIMVFLSLGSVLCAAAIAVLIKKIWKLIKQ